MATTPTTYKGYLKPTPGTESGTWGGVLNDSAFTFVDTNLGGVLPVTLAASDVTLSAAQARNVLISLTGTVSASVALINPASGVWVVENNTTGADTVFVHNGGGASVHVPQGYSMVLVGTPINGVIPIAIGSPANSSLEAIPAGARMLFLQSAVPTGWTLQTSYNDYLLKVSSAAGDVTGGSIPASTLFARTSVDGHALTTAQIPQHNHDTANLDATTFSGFNNNAHWMGLLNGSVGDATGTSSSTGSGNSHDHTLDLRAHRVTVVLGQRNA